MTPRDQYNRQATARPWKAGHHDFRKSLSVTLTIQVRYYSIILYCASFVFTFTRPSVCLSSVTFVRPTQATEIFGNVSTPFGTLAICECWLVTLHRQSPTPSWFTLSYTNTLLQQWYRRVNVERVNEHSESMYIWNALQNLDSDFHINRLFNAINYFTFIR